MLRKGVEYCKDGNENGGVLAFPLRQKVLIQHRMLHHPKPTTSTLPERSKRNLATTAPEFGLRYTKNLQPLEYFLRPVKFSKILITLSRTSNPWGSDRGYQSVFGW
jgi:hypothetical protein